MNDIRRTSLAAVLAMATGMMSTPVLASADVVQTVGSSLTDPSVLSNGLVAYLPFDGNYSDLQGNVTASAVASKP